MPALLIFIAYFAIALLSGAAISYPLHTFLANWFELDFDRVASRSVLIVAIIFFIALYRKLGFGSWQEIGFSSDKKQFFKDLAKGIGFGILIMSPVIAGLLITQNRMIDMDWEVSLFNILKLAITALISGLIIGILEETLFRGAMLGAIKKYSSAIFAVVVTSLFYALVHFIQPDIELNTNTLNWMSGFVLLKNALPNFADIPLIIDSLIALFLAGALLAIVRIRTNRIALCIGIHAGWVISIKIFKRVTDTNIYSDYAFLTGNYDKVIGYLAAVCIAAFIVLLLNIQTRKTQG
ncbi:MAG: CPBP family intramembrane metalloprotease [Gammaproteobacteria bacterium]|nr:MAG: CPBP family intramembrane metalloprotease [Gammaproteobacteria bacterium]